MSDTTADAYRLAADYLVIHGFHGGAAEDRLRKEADRIDGIETRNAEIGSELRDYINLDWRSNEDIGRKAWELVNTDRKLHKPPSTDELTARDDNE